jgi:hypothetical protein
MNTRNSKTALLFGAVLLTAACGGGGGSGGQSAGAPNSPPTGTNTAPTITGLVATQSVKQDESSDTLSFTIGDAQSAPADIALSVTSSDPLISADAIQLGGDGATRTLTIAPEEGVSGSAVVTVTATDPSGAVTTATVNVTVTSEQRSFTEMVNTAYAKSEDDEAETVTGFSWVDDPSEDPDAFDALLE